VAYNFVILGRALINCRLLLLCFVCLLAAAAAHAQAPAAPAAQGPLESQGYISSQMRIERPSANHTRLTGQVQVDYESGVQFFADEVDIYSDKNLLTARGNVVFVNPEGRISADRVEFDTRAQTGTFYNAAGIISLGAQAEIEQFGGQDPDVYFYGESVAKIGERKYRITKGGFTTCVQPTPRWELTSGTVTLNLDDYALLTNTVLKVKGVPVFYLPVGYYPIQEDQRATGFLLPTYGTSSLSGQKLSNAFFWAISRSQDATFLHDWFTRTGQGYGAEYRYVAGPMSDGNVSVYRFNQKAAEFTDAGETTTLPESQSFEVRANAVHALARGLRARTRVDYSSSLVTQQLYHQNVYDASRRLRVIQGGLNGAWGPYSTAFTYDRSEVFENEQSSFVYGSTPRVNAGIAPTRLFGSPVYGSVSTEFANLPYRQERDGLVLSDTGLTRFDLAPLVRLPISRWTFLTLNTSGTYRLTRYSERLNAEGVQVPEPFTRSYFDVRSEAVGPVFTKIWNAASGSTVERYKHVIEPSFVYQQITPVENYQSVPVLSNQNDFVVSGVARLTYGLTNRLLRRDRPREGVSGAAREFLSISVQQTYYSDREASQYDPAYNSSIRGRTLVDLSPVAVTVRYSPTQSSSATMRLEHDVSGAGLQVLTAAGNLYFGPHSASLGLSRRRIFEASSADTTLNGGGSVSFVDGRVLAGYAFDWDIGRGVVVNQRVNATYYAQCCGFGVEFQNYNYGQISSSIPLPADRRFNFSFTLAGLGTFSNFFGAFGGNGR
jgi:LPS-assembly protein